MSAHATMVYVSKSLFVESGTYQPMNLRTYQSNVTTDLTNRFSDVTESGKLLGKNSLSSIASEILTPSSAPTASLTIDEGWGTKRFTFVIELVSPTSGTVFGGESIVLTGYTNYTDLTLIGKQFDPNMRMYFNSSSIVSNLTQSLPNGQIQTRKVLRDSSHLLGVGVISNIHAAPFIKQQNTGIIEDGTTWLLPKHVIQEMQNQQTLSDPTWGSSTGLFDLRRRVNPADMIRSRRENAVTGKYLDKVLNTVVHEYNSTTGIGEDDYRALSQAAYSANEMANYSDPAMSRLLTQTGFLYNGYVTWGEFCSIFPGADEKTMYTTRDSGVSITATPPTDANNVSGWTGVDYETNIANAISQLVPAIMTTSLIGNISFAFTNDNLTMEPEVTIFNGNSMIDGLDMVSLGHNFTRRFINEIVPLITNQSRSIVSAIVHSNIGTETHISVSYDGGPAIPFCAPTFCDAMYTPIISPTDSAIANIASDLYNIATTVSNNHMVTNLTGGY